MTIMIVRACIYMYITSHWKKETISLHLLSCSILIESSAIVTLSNEQPRTADPNPAIPFAPLNSSITIIIMVSRIFFDYNSTFWFFSFVFMKWWKMLNTSISLHVTRKKTNIQKWIITIIRNEKQSFTVNTVFMPHRFAGPAFFNIRLYFFIRRFIFYYFDSVFRSSCAFECLCILWA